MASTLARPALGLGSRSLRRIPHLHARSARSQLSSPSSSSQSPSSQSVSSKMRAFHTSRPLRSDGVSAVRKPVGAFRSGLFGFLIGALGSAAAMYTYVLEEYRIGNELLTEDVVALQGAVARIEGYVRLLEERALVGGNKERKGTGKKS